MPELTDVAIRNAKPGDKPIKLPAGKGLFLLITPKGQKWWRLRYRFGDKEKMLSLGVYPEVTLKKACQDREEARTLLASGTDPSVARQKKKIEERNANANANANSFQAVGREWYGKFSPLWAETYQRKIQSSLDRDLFPYIGPRPIAEIAAPDLLAVARRVESRGALHTAHRVIRTAGQIFQYAVATGRATRDPSGDLRGALPRRKGLTLHRSPTRPAWETCSG